MRILGLLITLALLAAIWELAWGMSRLTRLGPRKLRRRLAEGWWPLLLDVRTAREYEGFHIPGAVNAPLGSAELNTALRLHARPDGERPEVVVVCLSGHRSLLAAWSLRRTGLADVYDLAGGMLGWRFAGGPTVSGREPGDPESGDARG